MKTTARKPQPQSGFSIGLNWPPPAQRFLPFPHGLAVPSRCSTESRLPVEIPPQEVP